MNYADIMFYLALAIFLTYLFICFSVIAVSWLIDLGYYVLNTFDKPRRNITIDEHTRWSDIPDTPKKKKNVPIHGTWDDDDNPF